MIGNGFRYILVAVAFCLATFEVNGREPSFLEGKTLSESFSALDRPARKVSTSTREDWSSSFSGPNFETLPSIAIYWDDGDGLSLYAAGQFGTADGRKASGIAELVQGAWIPLGPPESPGFQIDRPTTPSLRALRAFGSGLIAAGRFDSAGGVSARNIASWDGDAWSVLGEGVGGDGVGAEIQAIEEFNGNLVVGGSFVGAGTSGARDVARWDGSAWHSLGPLTGPGSFSGAISLMAVRGNKLIVSGTNLFIGGTSVGQFAQWDGSSWTPLQTGGTTTQGIVTSLANYDGLLVAGGRTLTRIGGVNVRGIASWDGSQWLAIPSGVPLGSPGVEQLISDEDFLYAYGRFESIGGIAAQRVARWDGSSWTSLEDASGLGFDGLNSFALAPQGVLAVGNLVAGSRPTNGIALWNGALWSEIRSTKGSGISFTTAEVLRMQDFRGELIVAGRFIRAGGASINNIARWDGADWRPLGSGSGPNNIVEALAVFDGDLYIGGSFDTIEGVPAFALARWDGTQWHEVPGIHDGGVSSLLGTEDFLVVGGTFTAGGAHRLRTWNGKTWGTLSAGANPAPNGTVLDLATDGINIYAAGLFSTIDAIVVNGIARWDGSGWQAMRGPDGTGVFGGSVYGVSWCPPRLYVAGTFTHAGGVSSPRAAAWDGARWHGLTSTGGESLSGTAWTAGCMKGRVFVGGNFEYAGGVRANSVAEWTGSRWRALGPIQNPGVSRPFTVASSEFGVVWSLAEMNGRLLVGGDFSLTGGGASWNLAEYDSHIVHSDGFESLVSQ